MKPRVLADASRLWGHRFERVVHTYPGANTILELSERRNGGERRSFLKLARPGQSTFELDFEARLLGAVLSGPEAAVAVPFPGKAARLRFRLPWEDRMRHAVLFAEAPGRVMRHDVSDMRRYGQSLAALHEVLAATSLAASRRIDAAASCRETAFWLRQAGLCTVPLAATVEALAPNLVAALDAASPTQGLLHGDSCLLNARLDEGERVTFFDFEDCGTGPVALDLASMTGWLEREENGPALWAALLDGYARHRALTPGDHLALPALAVLATVRVTGRLARFYAMAPGMWEEQHERLKGHSVERLAIGNKA
ncbi:MAG: phosphotransferase enzyme family protein [Janthinobacterium lividum]